MVGSCAREQAGDRCVALVARVGSSPAGCAFSNSPGKWHQLSAPRAPSPPQAPITTLVSCAGHSLLLHTGRLLCHKLPCTAARASCCRQHWSGAGRSGPPAPEPPLSEVPPPTPCPPPLSPLPGWSPHPPPLPPCEGLACASQLTLSDYGNVGVFYNQPERSLEEIHKVLSEVLDAGAVPIGVGGTHIQCVVILLLVLAISACLGCYCS